MISIIINADDFGLCRSVNEAIVLAYQEGLLTSATIMANMPGFDQAVALAKENPGLGIGLHLNIIKGLPIAAKEDVAGLLGPDGRFWINPYIFIRRLACGEIGPGELERETRAQIEKVLKAGLSLTHIDSEKHMHVLPPVFKIVLKLAQEYGIRGVRSVNERCFSPRFLASMKAAALSCSSFLMKKKIREHDIMTPDKFYGLCRSGRMTTGALQKIIGRAGEGVSEIMVHPGFMTPELAAVERDFGSSRASNLRERELEALLDPGVKRFVRERGIQLINFGG